jgi:polyphosphate kinase 2 (PPK2 family)
MAKRRDGGPKIPREEYKAREEKLRTELLRCQSDLMDEDFAVAILLNALDPQPANEVLNALFEWFDPRYLQPHALRPRTEQELREPFLRRYWKRVPADGRIAVFFGGAVLDAYTELQRGRVDLFRFTRNLIHLRKMERQLLEEGTHLIKLWIGELPKLDADDPLARLVTETDTPDTEWAAVETPHRRNRRIECGELVAESMARRLEQGPPRIDPVPLVPITTPPAFPQVDLSLRLSREEYKERRKKLQERLGKLSAKCARKKIASICAFEGWDAAGKGGAIRRLTQAMDAHDYQVVPIAAPTPPEKRRPHLWRFWMKLPRPGSMTIFDRTWYGRVLVERVEGFAKPHDWQRAYDEINDFEEQWIEKGFALAKFWLHIDKEEQLARFREREKIPYKQFKITEDDFRNREKWDDYEVAAEEMFARTSTHTAPWTIVPANDKHYARIRVLERVCESLEEALER